jgi:xanthosine utilization system XapX-like protein
MTIFGTPLQGKKVTPKAAPPSVAILDVVGLYLHVSVDPIT